MSYNSHENRKIGGMKMEELSIHIIGVNLYPPLIKPFIKVAKEYLDKKEIDYDVDINDVVVVTEFIRKAIADVTKSQTVSMMHSLSKEAWMGMMLAVLLPVSQADYYFSPLKKDDNLRKVIKVMYDDLADVSEEKMKEKFDRWSDKMKQKDAIEIIYRIFFSYLKKKNILSLVYDYTVPVDDYYYSYLVERIRIIEEQLGINIEEDSEELEELIRDNFELASLIEIYRLAKSHKGVSVGEVLRKANDEITGKEWYISFSVDVVKNNM